MFVAVDQTLMPASEEFFAYDPSEEEIFAIVVPEHSASIHASVGRVERIADATRRKEGLAGELYRLLGPGSKTAGNEIKSASCLVCAVAMEIEGVVYQRKIKPAAGLRPLPIVDWTGGARIVSRV